VGEILKRLGAISIFGDAEAVRIYTQLKRLKTILRAVVQGEEKLVDVIVLQAKTT
jgi:hypothetical protein